MYFFGIFLNYYKLQPNEAIYIEPFVPHSYLSGECLEVTGNSDNVIRAGFTNKLVDVKTFVDYVSEKIPEILYPNTKYDSILLYKPSYTLKIMNIQITKKTKCNQH